MNQSFLNSNKDVFYKIFIYLFSMEGGELFQRIQDRQDGQDGAFTERGK